MDKKVILARIKHLIDAYHGGNSKGFAEFVGIKSSGNIGDWFAGRSFPRPSALGKIAEHYNVSMDWIYGKTDIKSESPKKEKAENDYEEVENTDYNKLRDEYYILTGKFEYAAQMNREFLSRIENILTICEQQQHEQQAPTPRQTHQENATGHEQHDSTGKHPAIRAGHVRPRREPV